MTARTSSGGWALIWSTIRPNAKLAWIGVIAGLMWAAGRLVLPLLLGAAIQRGVTEDDLRGALIVCAVMLGVALITATAAGLRRFGAVGLAYHVEVTLRRRIYAHAQRMHQAFHDTTPTGELMSRTANDLQQIRNPITNGPMTIANLVMLVGAGAIVASIDPLLALVALAPGLLMVVVARSFMVRLGPAAKRLQKELAGTAAVVEEAVGGIRALKGLGVEQAEADKLDDQTRRVYDAGITANNVRAQFMPFMEVLPALGLVGVIWLGGDRVASGAMSLGALVSVTYYVLMLIWPMRSTGQTIAQLQRALVSARLVSELLDVEPQVVDARDAQPIPGGGPNAAPARVELRDVTFRYGSRRPALQGVSLDIEPGQTVALVGASGSGKSTLAALISRTYDATSGTVLLDGIDVRRIRLADLRTAVSTVFEDTFLFEGTVRDNIAFADPNASFERVQRAAELAGAHDFVSALPGGYESTVGGRGRSLSGGQRQRLALARAILPEPRVLILDDVMSAVDPSKEAQMRGALQSVIGGRTTILIAHRAATIRLADRVVLLERGRIAAIGTHDELMETSPLYRKVLAAPDHPGEQPVNGGGDAASESPDPLDAELDAEYGFGSEQAPDTLRAGR